MKKKCIHKSKKNGTWFEQQFSAKWESYCWHFMPCHKVNMKKICGSPFCNPLYCLLHWAGTSVQSHKIKYILLLKKWTFVSCFLYVYTLPPSSAGVCFSLLGERLLNHTKTLGFLAPRGKEFSPGPETWLDRSERLCNKVLLKYKGDREGFWDRDQKGAERVPPC